jgi:hypothetical protein
MRDLIPVEDNMGLLRDPKTNSIINNNKSQYNDYLRLKNQKEKENKKIQDLENDLNNIKCDLNEIKCLLMNLNNISK